jgi:hypothetical protein
VKIVALPDEPFHIVKPGAEDLVELHECPHRIILPDDSLSESLLEMARRGSLAMGIQYSLGLKSNCC